MSFTIRLVWASGAVETVQANSARVRDGVLVIHTLTRGEYRYIPLEQLREWTESE